MKFSESPSIVLLVRESRKPIVGSLMTEHILKKSRDGEGLRHRE
jgi:hypothetical protein